eukprot:509665_1
MDNFDLNVFKKVDEDDECEQDSNDNTIQNCSSLNRLCSGLKYYSLLDIINNIDHMNIFNNFIHDVYKTTLLDDFTHLVQKHGNHIQKINDELINTNKFKQCNINKCSFSTRHYRMETNTNNNNVFDPILKFYKDVMDSLHFYMFHLYDCGLRVTKSEGDEDNKDENKTNDEYFDAGLSRLTRIIKEAEINTAAFDRFKVADKFNIKVNEQDGNETFTDEIIKYLSKTNVANNLTDLICAIAEEEYDSDSLKFDINYVGNILNSITNKTLSN